MIEVEQEEREKGEQVGRREENGERRGGEDGGQKVVDMNLFYEHGNNLFFSVLTPR